MNNQSIRCCNYINEDGSHGSCEYNDGGWFCLAPDCKGPVITSTLCGARPSGCPFYDDWNRKTVDEEEVKEDA